MDTHKKDCQQRRKEFVVSNERHDIQPDRPSSPTQADSADSSAIDRTGHFGASREWPRGVSPVSLQRALVDLREEAVVDSHQLRAARNELPAGVPLEFRVVRPGAPVRRLRLTGNRYTFGSGEGCSIRLDDETLRPMHAVLLRDAQRVLMRAYSIPLECNGNRVTESVLRVGDIIRMGSYRFELLAGPQATDPIAGSSRSWKRSPSQLSSGLPQGPSDAPLRQRLTELSQQWHTRHAECEIRESRCDQRESELHSRETELWSRAEKLQRREHFLVAQEAAAKEIQETHAQTQQELRALRQREAEVLEELEQKRTELRNAQQQLQQRQDELERRQIEWQQREEAFAQQAASAQRKLEATQQQAQSANDAVGRMRADFAALNEQLTELRERHSELQQREQEQQAEQERLRVDLQASCVQLQSQCEHLQTRHDQLQTDHQQLQSEHDQAAQAREETEAERARLQAELDRVAGQLRATREEMETVRAESKTCQQELRDKLRSTNAELATARQQAEVARQASLDSQRQAEQAAQASATAQDQARQAQQDAAEAQRELEAARLEAATARQQVDAARQQAESARHDGDAAQKEAEAIRQAAEQREAEAVQRVAQLQQQLEQLGGQLDAVKQEREEEEQAARREIIQLRDQYEQALAGRHDAETNAEQLRETIRQLKDDLANANQQADEARRESENATASIRQLELLVDQTKGFQNQRHESWTIESQQLQQTIDELSDQLAAANADLAELRTANEALSQQLANPSSDPTDSESTDSESPVGIDPETFRQLEQELESARQEIERLKASHSETVEALQQQRRESEHALRAEIEQLREEIAAAQQAAQHAARQAADRQAADRPAEQSDRRSTESQNSEPVFDESGEANTAAAIAADPVTQVSESQSADEDQWAVWGQPAEAEVIEKSDVDAESISWHNEPPEQAVNDAIEDIESHLEDAIADSSEPADSGWHTGGEAEQDSDDHQMTQQWYGQPESESFNEPAGETDAAGQAWHPIEEPQPQQTDDRSQNIATSQTTGTLAEMLIRDLEHDRGDAPHEERADEADAPSEDENAAAEFPAAEADGGTPDVAQTAVLREGETVQSQADPGDDDSIEAYMSRLLQRIQAPSQPVETPAENGAVEVEDEDQDDESNAEAAPQTNTERASESADSPEPQFTPVHEQEPLVPRSQAPELKRDLSAMRDLANQSARNAVARSIRIQARDTHMKAVFKAAVAAGFASMALGAYLFVNWSPTIKIGMVGAFTVLAAVFGQEAYVLARDARRRLQLADEAGKADPEEHQEISEELRRMKEASEA